MMSRRSRGRRGGGRKEGRARTTNNKSNKGGMVHLSWILEVIGGELGGGVRKEGNFLG